MPKVKGSRNALDLKTKYDIIQASVSGLKHREVVDKFHLKSVSHVTMILKSKQKIIENYEGQLDSKRKTLKTGKYPDLDKYLVAFITDCNVSGLPINESLLEEEAKNYCLKNNINDFKASHGYFCKFYNREAVSIKHIHGDASNVDHELAEDWKSKLNDLTNAYAPKDVFNVDELGLFFQLIPSKTLTVKGNNCKNGKKSKQRITVLLGSNSIGTEKLQPFVIGKFEKPRAIKTLIDKKILQVRYRHNKAAWMTGELFKKYLANLNNKFKKNNRQTLFFLDNCPAHPHGLEFSNIKLIFLPKNTTSVLQPMDMGIIKVFKDYYKKRLIRHLLNGKRQNSSTPIDKVVVNLKHAIDFTVAAWKEVTEKTIKNCFRKSGFFQNEDNLTELEESTDPDLLHIWNDLNSLEDINIPISEYLSCDNDLAITGESAKDILSRLSNHYDSDTDNEEGNSESELNSEDMIAPKFGEMVQFIEQARRYSQFFESSNITPEFIDKMENEIYVARSALLTKQTKITDFITSTVINYDFE